MTQQTKHTPGPWEPKYLRNNETELAVITPDGAVIANFGLKIDFEIQEANARLIAAAPESHEANILALHAIDQARSVLYSAYAKDGGELPHRRAAIDLLNEAETGLRVAIAKATGSK
jgi:hypothetical protein